MKIENFEAALKRDTKYILLTHNKGKLLLEKHVQAEEVTLYRVASNGFPQQTSNNSGHHYFDFPHLLNRFGVGMSLDPNEYDFMEINYSGDKTDAGIAKMVGIL